MMVKATKARRSRRPHVDTARGRHDALAAAIQMDPRLAPTGRADLEGAMPTPRQRQVMALITSGLQVANELSIGEVTECTQQRHANAGSERNRARSDSGGPRSPGKSERRHPRSGNSRAGDRRGA